MALEQTQSTAHITRIWDGFICHLTQACRNVTVGCKTLHSSSEQTAHPSQLRVWGTESSREAGWTMEVKTAYCSSVCIQMEWFVDSDPFKSIVFRLSFVALPQYCEELSTPPGFSVLLDQSVLSKDHSDQYKGRWGKKKNLKKRQKGNTSPSACLAFLWPLPRNLGVVECCVQILCLSI